MLKHIKSATAIVALCAFASQANAQDTVATIKGGAPILTMVNVLTAADGQQDATIAQLQKALDTVLINEPGFISGSVHRSLDSNHIINYAQWKSQEDLMAFVAKLESGNAPEMAKVFAMATPDFHPYAVESVHRGKN